MKIMDRLAGVRSLDPDESRAWMSAQADDAYTLLDVRQPEEYEQIGHLPGAVLLPLPELPDRFEELDRNKPLLAY